MKNKFVCCSLFLFCLMATTLIQAQTAKLSIQGILKKNDGNAVDNGDYDLKFRLYTVADGGSAIWTETQSGIEVNNGIYSAVLGSVTPLNVPFNATYYLGVAVGAGAEMLPRTELTTAPYALSLIGQNNKFPSTGLVEVDRLEADGAVYAQGGEPNSNNTNDNGFAFKGNSGDNDSGLFSTTDGEVSLYTNGGEIVEATSSRVTIKTNATVNNSLMVNDQLIVTNGSTFNGNVNLANNKNISYNGTSDWRLVDVDYFESGSTDGWEVTQVLVNDGATKQNADMADYGNFNGWVMRTTDNNDALKKVFDLSGVGSFSWIKVKFKYYFTDSWDSDEVAIAGFATNKTATNPVICWTARNRLYSDVGNNGASYTGNTSYSDSAMEGEIIGRKVGSIFCVFFSMGGSSGGVDDERMGVSNVEIWVK